ncbi:T-lymphocyte activation antigen CD86-like, partial [Elgaria multicarinata webbii]|uniref:T-lymphocyte activation antigen CD86-like n=1 Tax=Elgaria multicarinata webbii TaxID=159646 RepID=UPI002FCCF6EF
LKGFLWLGLFVLQSGSSDIQRTAEVGKEAKLPCEYKIPAGQSLKSYIIYWQKPADGKPDLVAIAYKNGQKIISSTDPSYVNRTTMNEQDLTLSISSVKVSDIGKYKCIIILKTDKISETCVSLSVMANYSKPEIHADEPHKVCGPTQLTLKCSSHGGYPRTAMFGLVNNDLAEWSYTFTIDNQTELFNITGNLKLNVTEEDTVVQCSVGSEDFNMSTNYSLSRFLGFDPLHQP